MTATALDHALELEGSLREGLDALNGIAGRVGADSVTVVLVEAHESIRVLYRWPGNTTRESAPVPAADVPPGLPAAACSVVTACSAIGQLLNRTAQPARSFLLVPWQQRRSYVLIAFGFATVEPDTRAVPEDAVPVLKLAALAAWTAFEIRRTRRDLGIVTERLGRRKLVDRAKALLQARHGWSEQQAYEYLRKLTRQRRQPMAETAQDLLRRPPPA